jgi:hypothetical protein
LSIKLKVLKDADYVISRACGLCERISYTVKTPNHLTSEARCLLLDTIVSDYGSCEHFIPRPERIKHEFQNDPELEQFLEKREYTRSNRHQKKTVY